MDLSQPEQTKSSRTTLMKRIPAMRHLVELQTVMRTDALEGRSQKDRAMSARVWRELELLRRIMLNKPITVEPIKARMPKARKLGTITPMPDAGDGKDSSGYGLPV